MSFFSANSMREADAEVIAGGTPGTILMGRASRGLAAEMVFLADGRPRPVVVCCGPGNNGGDGFGLALHLANLGWPVEVWAAIPREKVKGDALVFLKEAERSSARFHWWPGSPHWKEAERFLPPGAWLVDALLGTGVTDAPRKTIGAAVEFLRREDAAHRVFAVDLPSGLNADTGEAFDSDLCVRADHTLTLAGAKLGFENDASAAWTGAVSVVDLGFEDDLLREKAEGDWRVFGAREARETLSRRAAEEHKGTRGHVLVIGGSPGMTGSVCMSARAALRSGAGLVTVWTPASCLATVDASSPEIMAMGGPEGRDGALCDAPIEFDRFDAVLAGPGLRTTPGTERLIRRVVETCRAPVVLDADALSILAGIPEAARAREAPLFLTPHPGEMGRLLGVSANEVQSNRRGAVARAREMYGAEVVLKGSRSRIASGGEVWVNLNGNPGMATGGTGDVLAGMTVSLAGQGVSVERVLPAAVYAHGFAGDLAAMRTGQSGLVAGDVIEALLDVWRRIQGR